MGLGRSVLMWTALVMIVWGIAGNTLGSPRVIDIVPADSFVRPATDGCVTSFAVDGGDMANVAYLEVRFHLTIPAADPRTVVQTGWTLSNGATGKSFWYVGPQSGAANEWWMKRSGSTNNGADFNNTQAKESLYLQLIQGTSGRATFNFTKPGSYGGCFYVDNIVITRAFFTTPAPTPPPGGGGGGGGGIATPTPHPTTTPTPTAQPTAIAGATPGAGVECVEVFDGNGNSITQCYPPPPSGYCWMPQYGPGGSGATLVECSTPGPSPTPTPAPSDPNQTVAQCTVTRTGPGSGQCTVSKNVLISDSVTVTGTMEVKMVSVGGNVGNTTYSWGTGDNSGSNPGCPAPNGTGDFTVPAARVGASVNTSDGPYNVCWRAPGYHGNAPSQTGDTISTTLFVSWGCCPTNGNTVTLTVIWQITGGTPFATPTPTPSSPPPGAGTIPPQYGTPPADDDPDASGNQGFDMCEGADDAGLIVCQTAPVNGDPDEDGAIDAFGDLVEDVKGKAPFGYAVQIGEAIDAARTGAGSSADYCFDFPRWTPEGDAVTEACVPLQDMADQMAWVRPLVLVMVVALAAVAMLRWVLRSSPGG